MRILTSILGLLAMSGPLAAATYKWVDKDGSVHYSDQPQPGAEVIHVDTTPPGSVVTPAARAPAAAAPAGKPFTYASCAVSSPSQDQVFFNTRSVNVSLNVMPALQPDHTIVVKVNGGKVAWPAGSTSYLLQDLSRGSFSVNAQVLNEKGVAVCNGPSVTFHIRQPSMLTPGAKAAPKS